MSVGSSPHLFFGAIVLAPVVDPDRGTPLDPHYAIVLSRESDIAALRDIRVAVITSSFSLPLRSGWFFMPHESPVHPITGLSCACVVKSTWINIIPQVDVIKVVGRAPIARVKQVENWLSMKERDAQRSASNP